MVIDFHTHTFPERIAEAALAKMREASHTVTFSDGTEQGLCASMREAGVDLSVVLPVATNPQKVRSINDLSAELTKREGLIYFGCIHPALEGAEQEIRRIAALGLKGVKLHPVYQGVDIDDPRYLRILEAAAEEDLIVLTHAGDDIGFPGVVRCSPEMIRRALLQVGGVKLVLAHMGGWKNWERVADALADTSAYLDTALSLGRLTQSEPKHYSEAEERLMSAEAFCALVRAFGADRVLFGTDSPWSSQGEEIAQIRALSLRAEEKDRILFQNARELLDV